MALVRLAFFLCNAALLLGLLSSRARPARADDDLAQAGGSDCSRDGMACHLWAPEPLQPGLRYPVVIYLHGAGQTGNDKKHLHEWADLLGPFISTSARRQYPAFVLAPQCPAGQQWVDWPWEDGSYDLDRVPESQALRKVRVILADLMAREPIDPDRIYVVGWSMGGYGAWDLVARTPALFAGAVPVMGGGAPGAASRMRNLAVWAVHNADDGSVPPHSDREMFLALARAGGRPLYTEGLGGGHFVLRAPGHPALLSWLFAQRRGVPAARHPDVTFSPQGGAYAGGTLVRVSSTMPSPQIRVTTDGSLPGGQAPLGNEAGLDRSAVVIAAVTSTGEGPEDTVTVFHAAPYVIGDTPLPSGAALEPVGGGGSAAQGGTSGAAELGGQSGSGSAGSGGHAGAGANGGAAGAGGGERNEELEPRSGGEDRRSRGCNLAARPLRRAGSFAFFLLFASAFVLARRTALGLLVAALSLGVSACTGSIDGRASLGAGGRAPADPGAGGGAAVSGGTRQPCADGRALAPARLWRLTDRQYVNAVRDLFGVDVPADVSAATQAGAGLNLAELSVINSAIASSYQIAAGTAARLIAAPDNLVRLLPCRSAMPDEACVESFVRRAVARAYRRPLAGDEIAGLLALFRAGSEDGPASGVELMLEAVLQSPHFLWRSEVGSGAASAPSGALLSLRSHELAGALSFALLDSVPDEPLWAVAEDQSLLQPAVLRAEVERLLTLSRVRQNLTAQMATWVGLDRLLRASKDSAAFPEFTPAVQRALRASGETFVEEALWRGQVGDLFSARRLHVNQALAEIYGMAGVTGDALVAVEATGGAYSAGVLTHPAVVAAHSGARKNSVVHRGLFVYETLLCGERVPPPPMALSQEIQAQPASASERELAELRAANSRCAGCHAQFDPLGLLSEAYDAIGRYRPQGSDGRPHDASAVVAGLGAPLDGAYDGIEGLAQRMVGSRRTSDCVLRGVASSLLGLDAAGEERCGLRSAAERFASSGSFTELFRDVATAPGFLRREVR